MMETLADFYQKFTQSPSLQSGIGHFNTFRLEDIGRNGPTYNRRDYYKILIIRGHLRYHYADKSIETKGTTLLFFNPQVPYTWESIEGEVSGAFCIFTESFFTEKFRTGLSNLPMFSPSGKPTYVLKEQEDSEVSTIFARMREEIASDYAFKYDLLRNLTMELIHYALKRQPSELLYQHPDANSRITSIFRELLERQFPIETPSQRFTMRSAKDFAGQLSVHVNHLNRAIRETTGKTTTNFITDRLVAEAKALLKHTDWNISEIGYSLGFDEPAHFNNFFKKQTQQTPSAFRNI
jgi:AraC family transcriptional activator of pobA